MGETQLERAKNLAITFLHLPMRETELSPIVVQHPFFENAILMDKQGVFNALEEVDRYNAYLRTIAKNSIISCDGVGQLLSLIRKSYRLPFLLYMVRGKIISTKEAGNLLAEQWSLIENLSYDGTVPKRTVLRWIMAADKETLMDAGELRQFEALPDIVTVYRGCRTPRAVKGMSWTLSEEKARWFADRMSLLSSGKCGDGSLVYRAKIRKEDIVGYLSGRGEREVIVDYRKLLDIELVEEED